MRSLLIVPADRAALPAALAARPGALVFDLGEPGTGNRAETRRAVADRLGEAAVVAERPRLIVRIAAPPTGLVDDDLDAILAAAPDAVMAPGIVGSRDVEHLGAKLAVREAMLGRRPGTTGIVAVAGDTARGILALAGFAEAGSRLVALAYDGAAFGAPNAAPALAARGTLVLTAWAAGVPALDIGRDGSDDLARACAMARRDGFSTRLARHPNEVGTIEACFGG